MAGVAPVGIGSIGIPVVTENESHHLSFARRFKAVHSADRRYWPERGTWMEWRDPSDGCATAGWRASRTPKQDMGRIIESNTSCRDRENWCRIHHIRGALELANETLAQSEWDRHNDLCALPSGYVINLRTGECRVQRSSDYLTLRTGCDVAKRVASKWSRFVLEVCNRDCEMAETLQLAVGSSAFGDNRHHRVEILCGDGGTGKSTFVETVGAALGSYAHVLPASILNSRSDQHPTGIASLLGRRFVSVPEVTGGTFKAETLKSLSGGDTIPARFMRQDFFTFRPVCTLWLMTNQPPALRIVDHAVRRRIRIWPFEARPSVPNPSLLKQLKSADTLSGVLRWIVDGAKRFAELDGDFPDCRAVQRATAQYFDATDSIGKWFSSRCQECATANRATAASVLFDDYRGWCKAESLYPVSSTAWGLWMGRRATKRRTRSGIMYSVQLQ